MEPTKLDQLFAAKAVLKDAGKKVAELEDECKAELLRKYGEDGTDRMRSPFFGTESGYMGVTAGKGSEREVRMYVADANEVLDWMDEQHPDCEGFARDYIEEFCKWWFVHTGEDIPGFNRIEYMTEPGKPTVRLYVKEKVVLDKLKNANLLEGVGQFLLGDGE